MGAPEEPSSRLEELERRIRAAREASRPKRRRRRGASGFTAGELAWRMTIELVAGMLIGAAMGWGLDGVFGTRPVFLVVFTLLGVAAGIRTAMRSAEEMRRRQAERSATEPPPGATDDEDDDRGDPGAARKGRDA